MTLWKQGEGKYSNKESKFAVQFREDHPELMKKLSNERGYLQAGKTLTEDGYTYTVKEITGKKDGKKYTLVERAKQTGDSIIDSLPESEEKIAHQSVKEDYWKQKDENIAKAHQENLTAQQNINEILIAILGELRRIADAQEAKHEI